MSSDINKPAPSKLRWFEWVLLFCAAISAIFAATGPISASLLQGVPEKFSTGLQSATWFLSEYGWYIAIVLGVSFIVWQRDRIIILYGTVLATLLSPVLQTRKAKIRYGDSVVFKHFTTGHYLTSIDGQNFSHIDGSGQQITFGAASPDENSCWVIRSSHGNDPRAYDGKEIKEDDVIRIYHLTTNLYLHSHSTPSPTSLGAPVSEQQREVTASAHNNIQDNWSISAKELYTFGTKWRFMHSDGAQYLHSHDRPIGIRGRSNTYEITCCKDKNEDDFWILLPAKHLKNL